MEASSDHAGRAEGGGAVKKRGTPVKGIRLGKDGKIIVDGPIPRDASQGRSWAKGGRKKSRAVTPAQARQFNTIRGK